jgi:hypothetical protein
VILNIVGSKLEHKLKVLAEKKQKVTVLSK